MFNDNAILLRGQEFYRTLFQFFNSNVRTTFLLFSSVFDKKTNPPRIAEGCGNYWQGGTPAYLLTIASVSGTFPILNNHSIL